MLVRIPWGSVFSAHRAPSTTNFNPNSLSVDDTTTRSIALVSILRAAFERVLRSPLTKLLPVAVAVVYLRRMASSLLYQASGNNELFEVEPDADEIRIKYARREKLYIYWEPQEFGLWSSPNMPYLRKPVHRPKEGNDKGLLGDYYRRPRKIRWLDTIEPFLGFWPLRPEWTGPFLCLNLIPGRLPITLWKEGRAYHMVSNAAVAWQELEGKLVQLGTGLLRRHITARYDWSEIRPAYLPYEFSYSNHFRTSDDCAGALYRSRNAFIPLTAFVSFTIALDMVENPPVEGTTPDWLVYAENKLGMDPDWLSQLAETFVCNFTPGFRPGCYVRGGTYVRAEVLPAYVAANVPIFFCWGFRPQYLLDNSPVWRYRPCRAEGRRAIDRYCDRLPPADDPRGNIAFWYNMDVPGQSTVPQTPSRTIQNFPSSSPVINDEGPIVVMEDSPESPPLSRQGEDESADPRVDGPEVLLARLAEERRAKMQSETGVAARDRQEVERRAEAERVDRTLSQPTIGETMIVWVERGENVFLPYTVPRERWEDEWHLYSAEERHYSADYKEWNLVRNGDFNEDDAGQFPLELPCIGSQAPTEPSRLSELGPVSQERRPTKTAEEQVEKLWKIRYSGEDDSTDWGSSSDDDDEEYSDSGNKRKRSQVAQRPRKRIIPRDNRAQPHIVGVTAEQSTQQRNPSAYSVTANRLPIPDARAVLRDKYRYLMSAPYSPSRLMSDVIRGEGGEVIAGLSKPLVALKRMGMESASHTPETRACVADFYNYFQLATDPKLSPPSWDLAPTRRHEIVNHAYFHYCRINSECHVIGVREKPLVKQWYLLVLYDARAVTELFYQQPESVGQMVRYLIQQGIPFATAKPVNKPPRMPANHSEPTLGYRPLKYQFRLSDFAAYERKRDELLSGSAGRAALMQGGLVWRLAVDTVQSKRITNGPGSSVAWNGKNIGDLDGYTLVDDYLSPDAEDTLCGVYRVYTGTHNCLFRSKYY